MTNFIAHFALQADQLDRARDFYQKVFGWRFEPWGPPDYFKVYTGDDTDRGVTEGGLSHRPAAEEEGRLNAFRCSISVTSVHDTIRAIKSHGGKVVSPMIEIPEVGKVVQFVDTEGNVVAAVEYAAADPRAARPAGLVGEVARSPRLYRVILPAGDMEASVAFNRRLLEMEGERVSPGRHYFACGGVILAVVDPRADGDDRDAHPNSEHVYLAVVDLESYHQRAAALRALSPEMGAIETRPWGERSFYLKDPFGNPLCFVDESTLFLSHKNGGAKP
jgi:predicted enzyme related to lactoylglutathione lyase